VELKIEVAGDQLAVAIRDNGCGLQSAAAPGADGLAGMRERLRQLGGECLIVSHPGQGTTVEFRLPVNGAASGNASTTPGAALVSFPNEQ